MKFHVLAQARALKRKEPLTGKSMTTKISWPVYLQTIWFQFFNGIRTKQSALQKQFLARTTSMQQCKTMFPQTSWRYRNDTCQRKKKLSCCCPHKCNNIPRAFFARVFRIEPCARYPKTKRIHPGGTLPHSLPCPSTVKLKSQCTKVTITQNTSFILVLGWNIWP